jgi:hypothetical protein
MKSLKLNQLLGLILFILFAGVACGGSYNTDFPVPNPKGANDFSMFPKEIKALKGALTQMSVQPPLFGFQTSYDNGKMNIQIVKAPNAAAADAFFKSTVVPKIDTMPSHSRAQVNGKWYAKGKEKAGRVWYGWVNQNWAFVINAADQDHFDAVVEAFGYIAK